MVHRTLGDRSRSPSFAILRVAISTSASIVDEMPRLAVTDERAITIQMRSGEVVVLSRERAQRVLTRLLANSSYFGLVSTAAELQAALRAHPSERRALIVVTSVEDSALRRVLT